MNIFDWTLYTERIPNEAKEKPFVSFYKPGDSLEHSFQIVKAHILMSGACWRFFSDKNGSFIFVVTDKVKYKAWPNVVMNQRLVHAFLCDNKIPVD